MKKSMTENMAIREEAMRGSKPQPWTKQETLKKSNDRGIGPKAPTPPTVIAKYKGRNVTAMPDALRIKQSGGKKVGTDLIKPVMKKKDLRND